MTTMNEMNNASKHLSFWQLLLQNEKIEIPIMQRDYAQGRDDKVKIRKKFLKAIFNGFSDKPVQLDFIYGSNKNSAMQPLDGQQRLTTLFLLYWYTANRENLLDDSEITTQLSKFTYLTRTSSREFCAKLINKGVPINSSIKEISKEIKDQPWFYSSWEIDPTIAAMLVMLDAIHTRFKDADIKWSQLTDDLKRPITFHYIGLEDFGLSDDLYIKMNARGKQLSSFENFKAELIKFINNKDWDDGKRPTETFSHKADTKWTDLFWDNGAGENSFDSAYLNHISNFTLCSWVNIKDNRETKIQSLFNAPDKLVPEDFFPSVFKDVSDSLDLYSTNNLSKIQLPFPLWSLNNTKIPLFSIIADGKATYQQRVLFYAQTKYLLQVPAFNESSFYDWMRVIRNVVINSTIDSAASFIGAVNLIDELCKGAANIYQHLLSIKISSNFASSQVSEEIIKASIITDENRHIIFNAEDTNFCKGRIEFCLYAIKDETSGAFNIERLDKINRMLVKHLNGNDVTNEFRRALLTIDDNEFYSFWDSWASAVQLTKYSLIKDVADLRRLALNKDYRHYLKTLLLKLARKEPSVIITEFLEKQANNTEIPNWKIKLISDKSLLDKYCRSHCIAIPDNEEYCYLLRVERPRDKNSCKKIRS
jgi:hypothetical protein